MNVKSSSVVFVASWLALAGCSKSDSAASVDAGASADAAQASAVVDAAGAVAAGSADSGAAMTAAAPVTFRTETNKLTNMKFELPSTWSTSTSGETLVAKSPTPGVGVEFVAASGAAAGKADETAMLQGISKTLQGAKFTSPMEPATQHGLKGFFAKGTGTKNGQTVEWMTSALGDTKGRGMLTTAFWSPNISKTQRDQLVHVLNSIEPAS